jgi:8-oxo-dGTP pyrophosphatase MutT (NUDIX family)
MDSINPRPRVTVAAIAENNGRLLLVEEHADDGSVRLNQPAGHVEAGESLLEAVTRETLEETGHRFTPSALVGIYHFNAAASGITYLRFAFAGTATAPDAPVRLDDGIVQALWLNREQLHAQSARHRSALVLLCIDDYLRGQRLPLNLVRSLL